MGRKKKPRPDEPPPELQNNEDEGLPPRPHPLHQLHHFTSRLYEIDQKLAQPYLNAADRKAAIDEFRFCLGSAESEIERLWVLLGKGYRETFHDF